MARQNYHYRNRQAVKSAPVTKKIDRKQVKNAAGGYVFPLDGWERLRRFLILGTEGGTYYVGEAKLARENAANIEGCLREDYVRAIAEIVKVSKGGLAPKNDPAIFALALACTLRPAPGTGFGPKTADACRMAARNHIPDVCRIPTHLFTFVQYYNQLAKGWASGIRKAISRWYQDKDIGKLAYQTVKYQQREGWSNRDILRLSHPVPRTQKHNAIFRWIVAGMEGMGKRTVSGWRRLVPERIYKAIDKRNLADVIKAFEEAKQLNVGTKTDRKKLIGMIDEYGLTREMIPTEALKHADVWEALLDKMPLTAMIRNLGNMSKAGLTDVGSEAAGIVTSRLADEQYIRRARVHPLQVILAMRTYAQGKGMRGAGTWTVNSEIVDALDAAFYKSFDYVEPTGKKYLLSVDISGSMHYDSTFNELMSLHEAAAVMMMTTMKSEPHCHLTVFHDSCYDIPSIRAGLPLDVVVERIRKAGSGGTDISSVIHYALGERNAVTRRQYYYEPKGSWKRTHDPLDVDAIVIYTDSETWHGRHPQQMFTKYKNTVNPMAKLIVVSMTATKTSVADSSQEGVLQVVGFDTTVPSVISSFVAD
jgi:60 kDa SS-A/Ro ribonucleoprotein